MDNGKTCVDGLLLDIGSTELKTAHSLFEVSLPQISPASMSFTLDFSFLIKQEPRPIHSREHVPVSREIIICDIPINELIRYIPIL